MDRLKEIIQVISRPLDFAARSGGSAIKDLGGFISGQITEALSQVVRPPAVETELVHLGQLFADYERLPAELRVRRVAEARDLLQRLEQRLEQPSPASEQVKPTKRPNPVEGTKPVKQSYRLWEFPIQYVRGVGPKKAEALARAGIRTVDDAVWTLPWRYEDRSHIRSIQSLVPGETALISAEVQSAGLKVTAYQRRKLVEVRVKDRTGSLHLVWFNQSYLAETFQAGQHLMLYGQVKPRSGRWTQLQMENPLFEVLEASDPTQLRADEKELSRLTHMGRIVPIYHARETKTRGMLSDRFRAIMKVLIDQYAEGAVDVLPAAILHRRGLVPFGHAIRSVHFPPTGANLEDLGRGRSPGHRRLVFEDFLLLELALGTKREQVKKETRLLKYDLENPLPGRLLKALPFHLTPAQSRVLEHIRRDLASPHPMNRLIQGDVGSGKTVVAMLAMLLAVGSGLQAALMAPTEILAEQHYLTVQRFLEPLGVSCVLLAGGRSRRRRQATLDAVAEGAVQVIVGTHALIQQRVRFGKLGLAVIDEQHKFGVLQRAILKEKGYAPDVLVMTATPIPRTLALTIYGDLDVSIIDALPPGRAPIRTLLFAESERARVYRLVEEELARGRQAYVVFPLVEESEKVDLQAAISGAARLQREVFPGWTVGLLHGRMKSDEKERVMASFKSGDIQVLVATTVIEVGIDVANATVMLIEHADRFGLAQLHQLRGRVGRGPHPSYCLLMGPRRSSEEGRLRLQAVVKSRDGFFIAEEDMRIRGPGEFFGTRQWGPADLRVANLIRDAGILEEAREEAGLLQKEDPELARPEHVELKAALLRRWREKLHLGKVS